MRVVLSAAVPASRGDFRPSPQVVVVDKTPRAFSDGMKSLGLNRLVDVGTAKPCNATRLRHGDRHRGEGLVAAGITGGCVAGQANLHMTGILLDPRRAQLLPYALSNLPRIRLASGRSVALNLPRKPKLND